MEELGDCVS